MSNPYAGADNFPATIPVLDDGDPPDASTWAPAYEGLADRTQFLRTRLPGSHANDVLRLPLRAAADGVRWRFDIGTSLVLSATEAALYQVDVSAPFAAYWDLQHLRQYTLTEASVMLAPAGGHGALSATMPVLDLLRQDASVTGGGPPTIVATATDLSPLVAVYESPHVIGVSGLSEVIEAFDLDTRYYLRLRGEAGANAVAGLAVWDAFLIVDP